jgi:tetratricopeptide (TPR) repeat protein
MKCLGGVFAFFLAVCTATACFWVTGTSYQSKRVRYSGVLAHELIRELERKPAEKGFQMEAELRNATNYNERSDYAVALAYLGRSKESVELLQKLEKEQPGNYFVAANLGTALELTGDNEEALRWIREGIRRNPDSHDGTEWLHVKILEAKISQQKNPAYFTTHSVLDLDPEQVLKGISIDGKEISAKEVAESIHLQLQERLQFVKPPDPAVASLLFDYAAIVAATNTLETAKTLLNLAVKYGYPTAKVESQLKLYDHKIAYRKAKLYMWFIIPIALGVGILRYLSRRASSVVSTSKDMPFRTG